ncbi:type 1 glutamine amidotransferase domain-containing protein [uncultured Thalassolituus sp.]|uniref:type 1 glutamine amidotransferase domain-containing protein n=1 Tax=uncultured Thalassolituus sp. TaxID=285273 RepID=UPI00261A3D66|nr:type 1 glutamine amidotransferase domain-containing protein [uncultured Thalassolituus sp.]
MTKRILHVVTNVDRYLGTDHPTGLWLSELTHAWDVFEAAGYQQTLVSPEGGKVPLEPRSLKWPALDASAKRWLNDPAKMSLLENTPCPEDLNAADFDAVFYTGGHAVMYDFPDHVGLQQLASGIWGHGGVVSSVCHGYCGLLNIPDSEGGLVVSGRSLTGFSWTEEVLAGVAKKVPYNCEQEMKDRGADYQKTWLPFASNVVTDGRLVTGQNPGSASATARAVLAVI